MDRLHVRKLQSTAFDACAVYISVMDLEGEEIDIPSLIITKGFLISEYENSYDFIVESACTSLLKQFKLVCIDFVELSIIEYLFLQGLIDN